MSDETKVKADEVKVKVEQVEKKAADAVGSEAAAAEDPDAEKRAGIKEIVANSEAMAVEGNAQEPEKDCLPSFFVKRTDRHTVEVDILSSKRDGRIMSVSRTGLGLDFSKDFPYLRHDKAWFEFSLPNYEDMSTYRQRSATFRKEAQQVIVDKLNLRNHLLVWHLKGWSLTDDKGNKVPLEHEDTGALNEDSVSRVYALNPTMLDVVLTLYEKDILLT
jgi:hypothetical protein